PVAGVAHREQNVRTGAGARRKHWRILIEIDVAGLDDQPAALRHGVARVDDQVQDDLLDLSAVGAHEPERLGQIRDELDILGQEPRQHLLEIVGEGAQVEDLGLEHLPAAERQQLTGEARGAVGGAQNLAEPVRQILVAAMVGAQQLTVGDDGGEQVVEVVRDTAGEMADGFHLLRLPELFLEAFAVRDVANDGEHAGRTVGDEAHRDRLGLDGRAVQATERVLDQAHGFAPVQNALDSRRRRLLALDRHDVEQRTTDYFPWRASAEQREHRRVDEIDDAVALDHDAVGREL